MDEKLSLSPDCQLSLTKSRKYKRRPAVNYFLNNLEAVSTFVTLFIFDESVDQLVSERDELVTFSDIISTSGNSIQPLFILPRDHFMPGAPEGSLGATIRGGWINSGIFT